MAKSGGDMIGRIIGIVFAVYVCAYALLGALGTLVNGTGLSAGSAAYPIITGFVPIIVALGLGWMFYKHANPGK